MSSPPACCPPGSWPQLLLTKDELNQDEAPHPPQGQVVNIKVNGGHEDLPIYHTSPPNNTTTKGGILIIPDIYSVRCLTPNVRSGDRIGRIADMLAEAGYTVALAGVFRDQAFDVAIKGPEDGDFEKFNSFAQEGGVAWFQQQGYEAKMKPAVQAAYSFLKEKLGNDETKGIAMLGFCYGSWLLTKASAMGDVDLRCAVGCHPAVVLEQAVFGGSEVDILKSLKQPTLFLWAGNDSEIYIKDGEGVKALEASGGGVVEFSDMLHGWVSRGDMADPKVKADVEKAIGSLVEFLDKHMAA